ncbi:MAG: hypothetical protein ACTHQ3_21865 [Motilibacteraceae bacterium]
MPLIDVTYDQALPPEALRRLGEVLPDLVAEAVACPEEPWTGPPQPGDVEIRFRPKGPYDVGELHCVVEVRTKLFASRLVDRHERAERVRTGLVAAVPEIGLLGVWLVLHEGAWAQ